MKRLLLAGLAIVAIGLGYSLAQTVLQQQLLGTEAWQVGQGPAGPGFYTNVSALRGGQNYAQIATGSTITLTVSPNIERVIAIGAITTLNMSLPSAPFDGQTVAISCPGGAITTLTVSAVGGSGQNVTGLAPATCSNTVAQSGSAMWTFVSSTPTAVPPGTIGNWQRVQ